MSGVTGLRLRSAYDKQTVTIELEEGMDMVFDRTEIALIRLAFDF